MIKQREEEAGALGEVIRKVTHKGEIEIDSSEIGDKIIMEVCVCIMQLYIHVCFSVCTASISLLFSLTVLYNNYVHVYM